MKKNLLSIAITIAVIGVISTSASAQSRAVFHGLNCKGYLADQSYFEYGGWGTRNTKTTGTSFLICPIVKARQPNSDAHGFYLQPYQGTSYPNFDVWFTLACNATTSLKCSQRAVASDLTFWISPEVTSAGSFCSVIQKIGIFGWHPGRLDAYDWHIDCTVPARDNIGSYTYIHNYDVYFEALTNGSDWQ